MQDDLQDDTLAKLQDEKARLEERLRLLDTATASERADGPVTESPESVRDELDQVNRLIAEQARKS